MKITVTPACLHPDGSSDRGESYVGRHAVISSQGVWLDGEQIIRRDRRAKRNRERDHQWINEGAPRTTFRVDVEP